MPTCYQKAARTYGHCSGCGTSRAAARTRASPVYCEPGEVDSGGGQGEVGGDFEPPADLGPAVAAPHEVDGSLIQALHAWRRPGRPPGTQRTARPSRRVSPRVDGPVGRQRLATCCYRGGARSWR